MKLCPKFRQKIKQEIKIQQPSVHCPPLGSATTFTRYLGQNRSRIKNYLDHDVVSEQRDCCRQDGPEVDRPEGRQVLDRAEAEPGLEVAATADQLQDQG